MTKTVGGGVKTDEFGHGGRCVGRDVATEAVRDDNVGRGGGVWG